MENEEKVLIEIKQLNEKLYKLIKKLEAGYEQNDFIEEKKELYRIFHTLKSLALMAGFERLSNTIHQLELLLNDLKNGSIDLNNNVLEIIYRMHQIITSYLNNEKITEKDEIEVIEKINNVISNKINFPKEKLNLFLTKIPEDLLESFTEEEKNRVYINAKKGNNIFLCTLTLDFDRFEKQLESITNMLKKEGELISTIPGDLIGNNKKIKFHLVFASSKPINNAKKMCKAKAELSLLIKGENGNGKEDIEIKEEKRETISPQLKIKSTSIDKILGDIDELIESKNNLINKTKEVTESFQFEKLQFQINLLNKKISELYKNTVNLRFITLWPLFQIIENTIKTTASSLGKRVKVEIKGANVKIDKPIIDTLVEPLIHLARNAMDHGIESPEERIKKGKSAEGKITIKAYQSENSVYIEFSDDGRGIDLEKVKNKAEQLGLTKMYHQLNKEQLLQFIFQQGFSTKEDSSKISGRGIGLDTVKSILTSLGGDIFIKTESDTGTTFILKLPLTTAIMPLFFANVEDFIICIPEFAIIDISEFDKGKLSYINDKTYYRFDNKPIPLINLPQLLNKISLFSRLQNILTINFANTSICVLVDRIIGHDEKTIIPFKGKIKKIPLFSGVCRYNENQIGFVLDVNQLIDLTRKKYETKIKFTIFDF